MRFFSNEAKENADGPEVADTERDRAESDAAAVPHQRSGSPWSDTPGSGNAASTDATDRSAAEPDGTADTHRDDEVRPEGSDSVREGDTAHADDDVDLPLEDRSVAAERGADPVGTDEFRAGSHRAGGTGEPRFGESAGDDSPFGDRAADDSARDDSVREDTAHDDTLRDDTVDHDTVRADSVRDDSVREDSLRDDTVGDDSLRGDSVGVASAGDARVTEEPGTEEPGAEEPGAEQRGGTTTTYGPDGTRTTVDDAASDRDGNAEPVTADRATDEDRDLDEAAPVLATAPVGGATPAGSAATDSPVADSGDAGSAPVDTAVDGSDAGAAGDSATGPGAVAAVPVGAATTTADGAAKPDPTAAPVGDRLFTDGDSFNDRLRDIALNFVDNPKEATEQAGSLVDEAIEKVTGALRAQKDALAGEGDDTEKLRVQLRGYRDILKRLTAL